MNIWSILSCLVVLYIIEGIFCDGYQDDQNSKINERTKRYHENDCQKQTVVENKPNKSSTPVGRNIVKPKPKTTPKPVTKSKIPINERNEPKDVRAINHILEEIATIAHDHTETEGIHKIRHLVDEIDNIDNMKSRDEVDNAKTPVKANKNEVKPKATNKLTQEYKTIVQKVPVKDTTNCSHDENKGSMNINVDKSLSINGRRCNNELSKHADETTKTRMPNENHIEIEEHKYEEECLRSPYKYNTYYYNMGQYDNAVPLRNLDGHIFENDSAYFNNYPVTNYGQYDRNNGYYTNWQYDGNNGYYYANSQNPSNQRPFQKNEDYTRSRKSWLDRDTIINARNINANDLGKIINGYRGDITNQSPEFYRKYYTATQKQYSNNNEVLNQLYYVNPYQCSK